MSVCVYSTSPHKEDATLGHFFRGGVHIKHSSFLDMKKLNLHQGVWTIQKCNN